MLADNPVTETLWLVVNELSSVVLLDKLEDIVPYFTCDVEASSVVHVIVALELDTLLDETLEMEGPDVSVPDVDVVVKELVEVPALLETSFDFTAK